MGGAEAEARVARSPSDVIAELYDPWSRSVVEDVPFYVAEARKAGGPQEREAATGTRVPVIRGSRIVYKSELIGPFGNRR